MVRAGRQHPHDRGLAPALRAPRAHGLDERLRDTAPEHENVRGSRRAPRAPSPAQRAAGRRSALREPLAGPRRTAAGRDHDVEEGLLARERVEPLVDVALGRLEPGRTPFERRSSAPPTARPTSRRPTPTPPRGAARGSRPAGAREQVEQAAPPRTAATCRGSRLVCEVPGLLPAREVDLEPDALLPREDRRRARARRGRTPLPRGDPLLLPPSRGAPTRLLAPVAASSSRPSASRRRWRAASRTAPRARGRSGRRRAPGARPLRVHEAVRVRSPPDRGTPPPERDRPGDARREEEVLAGTAFPACRRAARGSATRATTTRADRRAYRVHDEDESSSPSSALAIESA